METDYKVKLEVFEGPLDLLLYLIKRDEVDIYDISIERITRQYLEYLQAFKELKIDVAGEFVVMAANLIYLKSRSLLPLDQQPPEEDADEDDPRWDLIRQLIEYKKFKEAAAQLHDRELEQERIFTRDGGGGSISGAPQVASGGASATLDEIRHLAFLAYKFYDWGWEVCRVFEWLAAYLARQRGVSQVDKDRLRTAAEAAAEDRQPFTLD